MMHPSILHRRQCFFLLLLHGAHPAHGKNPSIRVVKALGCIIFKAPVHFGKVVIVFSEDAILKGARVIARLENIPVFLPFRLQPLGRKNEYTLILMIYEIRTLPHVAEIFPFIHERAQKIPVQKVLRTKDDGVPSEVLSLGTQHHVEQPVLMLEDLGVSHMSCIAFNVPDHRSQLFKMESVL